MSKVVIFDVGRVLINWDVYRLYRQLLPDDAAIEAFFDEVSFFEWNLEFDRGRNFASGTTEWVAAFPHHEHLIRAFDERWLETIPGPIDGSVELLNRLVEAGTPVYAITNFSAEKWVVAQQCYDFLRSSFIDVVVSGQEELLKPDPEIYRTLLRRNELNADECLFIDDSPKNVDGARAVGMDAVLFTSPETLELDLVKLGVLDG